ncbi:PaaI family thioesterase [Streptomyces sp. QTS137]
MTASPGIDLTTAQRALDSRPSSRLPGARVTAFGDGAATLEIDVRAELRQNGFLYGGVLSHAAGNALTDGFPIQCLRPATGHDLRARAQVVSGGRRQAVVRCDLHTLEDDGTATLCVVAQGTVLPVSAP